MKARVNQEKYNSDDFLLKKKKSEKKGKRKMRNLRNLFWMSLLICTPTFIPESYFNIDILV